MEYYHDLVTQKSWEELKVLSKTLEFTLIGGWATYLYTKALKSKDIDIIIDFDKLAILGKNYSLFKNERLKKYEAVKGEVQIDIYLPHFSILGIVAEELIKNTEIVEGFRVLNPNFLFALKVYTLAQRGRSPKGRKDFLDLISLTVSKVCDLSVVSKILEKYNLKAERDISVEFLNESTEIKELSLNSHGFSRIKKEIKILQNSFLE